MLVILKNDTRWTTNEFAIQKILVLREKWAEWPHIFKLTDSRFGCITHYWTTTTKAYNPPKFRLRNLKTISIIRSRALSIFQQLQLLQQTRQNTLNSAKIAKDPATQTWARTVQEQDCVARLCKITLTQSQINSIGGIQNMKSSLGAHLSTREWRHAILVLI